jgi:uncharacterized protein (TIGR00369 family)
MGILRTPTFLDVHEGRAPPTPIALLLQWKTLEYDSESGFVRGEMYARSEFVNAYGVIQGGMLCAMLDNAAGLAVLCALGPGQSAPTLDLKASFMRPAGVGKYLCEAYIRSRTPSICFVEAKLESETRGLVATASATARILRAP